MLSPWTIPETSGVALAGLVGCTGSPSDGSDASTPTPTEEGEHDGEGGYCEGEHGQDEADREPVELTVANAVSLDDGEYFESHVVRATNGGTACRTNKSGTRSMTAYSRAHDGVQLIPDGATAWRAVFSRMTARRSRPRSRPKAFATITARLRSRLV